MNRKLFLTVLLGISFVTTAAQADVQALGQSPMTNYETVNSLKPGQFKARGFRGISTGIKWCSGEWYCDKSGCVCVVKKGGGSSALIK